MKSLYSSINKFLHNWQDFSDAVNKITDDNSEFPIEIEGIQGCLFSYFLSELSSNARVKTLQSIQYSNTSKKSVAYQTFSQDMVIVVPGEYELNNIITDINALFPDAQVFAFPGWGVIPYRPAARGSVVFGQRAGFLAKLLERTTFTSNATPRIFLLTQRSFISPLPPPDYTCSFTFSLKKNDSLDTVKIAQKLISLGYTRVSRVNVRGEFSLRGEVLDIFLPLEQNPVRIVFDFDEIESIKDFEADSQITLGSRDKITIYPMKEVLWTDELVEKLRQKLTEYQDTALAPDLASDNQLEPGSKIHLPFTEHAKDYLEMMLDELSVKKETEGEELYYSLLWDKEYTILDYLTPDTFVLFYDYDRLLNAELAINREQTAMYRKTRETTPVLPPDMITLDFKNTVEKVLKCLLFRTISDDNEQSKPRLTLEVEPARSFFGNLNYLKEELTNLQNDGWNITIFTDNDNQQLRIHEIFKDWTDIEPDGTRMPVQLIPKAISAGFSISKIKLLVIQENEIFGRRKYVAKSVNKAKSKAIDTFVELNPGDYIVHVNWGIGLFHGIERVKSLGNERDYIKLEYADQEFAFVPIEQVNLVQRYIGNEGEKPRLDRIGSKSWENRKS